MRSLCPGASILALSATCTQKIRKRVTKILRLNDAMDVSISPNRENIKLVGNKISNTLESAMAWMIDPLKDGKFPKTLVYCHIINDASNIYKYICTKIPDCRSVDMYHSETEEDVKKT